MKKYLLFVISLITLSGCTIPSVEDIENTFDFGQKIVSFFSESEDEKINDSQIQAEIEAGNLKVETVEACNLTGNRDANAIVNIGAGDREYYAKTNENKQLVEVYANELSLQNDKKEDVKANGRYCNDEARVEGTESSQYDQGHVIADSLGGVSNAYNITPQASELNRHGLQADMEEQLREALASGKEVTNFHAIITYPNMKSQTPSHYQFTYKINGRKFTESFDNK